jgi:very-short-patch-repair endonuclease
MKQNKILHYNQELKKRARELRRRSTFSEKILWSKIRRKALEYEFHRQVPIDEYIVDFYCHELKLAIEIDGTSHDDKLEYDMQRQEKLEHLGVIVVRFDNKHINKNMIQVLRILTGVISEIEDKEIKK